MGAFKMKLSDILRDLMRQASLLYVCVYYDFCVTYETQ